MEGNLVVPTRVNAYTKNCVKETAESVYGRDNRVPIHDAIRYSVGMIEIMGQWCEGIGLCVENGKLCAVFNR